MPASSSEIPTESANIVGRMAGEYRLRRKLGEGGFGAVYEAEHPVLKRRAAVKVLHRVAGRDSDAVLRFISEAKAANQIRSRHIVDVFSFGQLPDGRHFFVMDLVDGEPLDRCLRRLGRFDVPTALQVLGPIAEALDAAHAAGIVHRDLKPQNVFLAREPNGESVPKLLDFGLAKLLDDSSVHTLSGTPMGTPLYMSPEQARGEPVDGRSDVYALGVLCHELLTGQPPIGGDSTIAVLMAHVLKQPRGVSEVCADLASALDAPILHMLAKQPRDRPTTAGAAIADLQRSAEQAGHVVPPGMPRLPPPPPDAELAPDQPAQPFSIADTAPASDLTSREHDKGKNDGVGRASRSTLPGEPPAAPRGRSLRTGGIIVGAAVLAAVMAIVYRGSGKWHSISPADTATSPQVAMVAPPPRVQAPQRIAPPGAATAPPRGPQKTVAVTVRGAPRGAKLWVDGKPVGEASDPVVLPFGQAPVPMTVSASGYETATVTVVPDRTASVSVRLKKRPSPAAIPRDLESPF